LNGKNAKGVRLTLWRSNWQGICFGKNNQMKVLGRLEKTW